MRRPRLTLLLTLVVLALPSAAVAQQQPNDPFGPLPQPAPEATPTPTAAPSVEAQQETDRTLLFAIGGGLLVLFVVVVRTITRDARRAVRASGHDQPARPRDEGPHKHGRQAKAKARAKTKAQRRARRQNR